MEQRPIRALVSAVDLDTIEAQAAVPRDPGVQLLGVVQDLEGTLDGIRSGLCDILLVACSGQIDRSLQLIHTVHQEAPTIPILVVARTSPNGFLRRAFEYGATDVITLPESQEELHFAMVKSLARAVQGASSSDHSSSMICVLGPKGGTGKTLTTCNLAVALASFGERVLVIDLDLQFGDVALCLGASPEVTIYDLAVSGGSLDLEKLLAYSVQHPSGLQALLAPNRPDQASMITTELLRDVYAVARTHFDYVVIDTPPGFTAEVIAAIDGSSDVIMVGMLDSLSLKNTKLGLQTLDLMGYNPEHVKLVLNRANSHVGISDSDVIAILGQTPDILVPSDREIPRAVNEGVPIVMARPQSEAAAAFRDLAGLYSGNQAVPITDNGRPQPAAKRKLFGRKA